MINVLHLINYLGSGGTEKYILSLGKKLHGNGCRFYAAYSDEATGRQSFEDAGIELFKLDMKSPADILASRKLKALCGRLSIDVVHTHFLRENYISILSGLMGNRAGIINTRHMLFENSGPVIAANRLLTRFNGKIIAVSASVRNQLLREGIKPEKVKLIYNGVDADEWAAPVPLTFRDEYGISADETVITSVARFSPEKGHDFFIEAIRCFKDFISEKNICPCKFRFVLAGDGALLGSMTGKAISLGLRDDILFTGYRTDIKNVIKSSDIFVSHSNNEALGISILEAMAAGLPVISTNSGGAAEIVNDSMKTGLLVDFGDKEAMAHSLISLIGDSKLREQYILNGRRLVREQFGLDKMAEDTYNLYEKCIETFRKGDERSNDR